MCRAHAQPTMGQNNLTQCLFYNKVLDGSYNLLIKIENTDFTKCVLYSQVEKIINESSHTGPSVYFKTIRR